jgi:peptidoglycan/LPS O-acetylase OafA/YrhL
MYRNSLPSYRRDIDALRGIAVLSVVAFHVFPDYVKGGFVGVDVFFVISGFLISTIIFKNLSQGEFSFTDFYIRRIKRIFPALSLLLVACFVFGWSMLFSNEYQTLGKHVAAGAGFLSNVVLWKEAGYFDRVSELKPLLHLWSLGIEEQFYIVWPLLAWVAWKAGKRIVPFIVIVWVSSFVLNLLCVFHALYTPTILNKFVILNSPVAAFFSPVTRFWELLSGSLLGYVSFTSKNTLPDNTEGITRWNVNTLANSKGIIGAMFLASGVAWLDRDKAFPGAWALLPTLGTFLLIWAGQGAWINRKLLGNELLVFVGLISYPLYLWHWPLLSFTHILNGGSPSIRVRIAVVVISFVLAALTYRLVEKPVRASSNLGVPAFLLLAMICIGSVGFYVFKAKALPRLTSPELENIIEAVDEYEYPGKLKPFQYAGRTFYTAYGKRPGTVLYVGDSNMQQYASRIENLILEQPDRAKTAVFAAIGGCPPIPNVNEKTETYDCIGFAHTVFQYGKSSEVDTVVVGAQWSGYFSLGTYFYKQGSYFEYLKRGSEGTDKALGELETMLAIYKAGGKKCYLVLNHPIGVQLDPKRMLRRTWLDRGGEIVRTQGISRVDLSQKIEWISARLIEIANRAGAVVIDPLDYLCGSSICPASDGVNPVYMDPTHLRPSYVREHVGYLDRTIIGE